MNANHRSISTRRHERTLVAYSSALDRGDFAAVAEILSQAADDPTLERLILELNAAYAAELGTDLAVPTISQPKIAALPDKEKVMMTPKSLRYPQQRSFATAAALLIVLVAIIALIVGSTPLAYQFLIALTTPTVAPPHTPTPVAQPSNATNQGVVPITASNVSKLSISQMLGRGYFSGGFAWSGNQLAVTSPLGISIFDTDDLAAAPVLLAYQANTLGFSADGKTLISVAMITGSSEITGSVTRWDVATRRLISTSSFPLGADGAWFADLVAENTLLPYEWAGKLRFYNLLTDQIDIELSSAAPLRPTGVTLSPDGKYAAAGTVDKRLHIWEVAKPEREKFILADAKEQVYSMAFTPDSQHLITADNRYGTLRQWDMATGKQIPLATVNGSVYDIKFSPTGALYVTANQDGTIDLYNGETNNPIVSLTGHHPTAAEGRAVARLSFNADGSQLASVGDDGTIKLWDMRGGQEIATVDSQSVCPDQLGYSNDGQKLIAMCEDSIQVWEVASAKLLFTTRTDIADINSARISPDGKFVAFTENRGVLQVWDIDANKRTLIHEIQRSTSSTVNSGGGTLTSRLSFSHDGRTLAFAHAFDSVVWLYDLESGQEKSITGHTQAINALQFSPDDRMLFSASADNSFRVWDVAIGALKVLRDGDAQPITTAQYSPDGTLIAVTYADSTLKLLDAQTLIAQTILKHPIEQALFYSGLAFTPDGSVLASFSMPIKSTTDANTITFWDVRAEKQIATLTIPVSYLRSMALSPDGAQLAVSVGGAVLFYQITS